MKTLRPYQIECLQAIQDSIVDGERRKIFIKLATGAGKTFLFAHLPIILNVKRTLVLAHREELLLQAQKTFRSLGIEAELEQGNNVSSDSCPVVVASVQTLSNGRLSKFNSDEFDLIICDECHHCPNDSYENIIDYFDLADVVGVTATPDRLDEKSLLSVFTDGMVFDMSADDLIDEGYLAPYDLINCNVYSVEDCTQILNIYKKEANGLKTIIFCKDVLHSISVANTFVNAEIKATAIYGKMKQEDRAEAIKQFASGEITVLANCLCLTEGFDEPSIQCVIIARKTESTAMVSQMIGRGLRLSDNKDRLKVIQLVKIPRPFVERDPEEKPFIHEYIPRNILAGKPSAPVIEGTSSNRWAWIPILIILASLLFIIYALLTNKETEPVPQPVIENKVAIERYSVLSPCNLRAEPKQKSKVVMVLGPMDLVTIITSTKNHNTIWTHVDFDGVTGWCGCKLMKGTYYDSK
jgi:superfamily II DNA or RNA helicase